MTAKLKCNLLNVLLVVSLVAWGCSRSSPEPASSSVAPAASEDDGTAQEEPPAKQVEAPATEDAISTETQTTDGCPPLKVVINGEEVEMVHGLAYRTPDSVAITVSNKAHSTCEHILKNQMPIAQGEQYFGASITTKFGGLVNFRNNTSSRELEEVRFPQKVGEEAVICLTEPLTFSKTVSLPEATIVGRFAGQYCGERER